MINKGVNKKSIFAMDSNVIDEVFKHYQISIAPSEMLHLPYERPEKTKKWESFKKNYQILTICRADFPFKSYVLGLIDAVELIREKGINCKLTIISYGRDIDTLKNKCSNKKYVQLIGETRYDLLEKVYLESDVYVGMGSTVIEAASYGLPSILANVDSPDFFTCGLFCDNPEGKGIFNKTGIKGCDLLLELLVGESKNLKKIGDCCYSTFCESYSVDEFEKNSITF